MSMWAIEKLAELAEKNPDELLISDQSEFFINRLEYVSDQANIIQLDEFITSMRNAETDIKMSFKTPDETEVAKSTTVDTIWEDLITSYINYESTLQDFTNQFPNLKIQYDSGSLKNEFDTYEYLSDITTDPSKLFNLSIYGISYLWLKPEEISDNGILKVAWPNANAYILWYLFCNKKSIWDEDWNNSGFDLSSLEVVVNKMDELTEYSKLDGLPKVLITWNPENIVMNQDFIDRFCSFLNLYKIQIFF